MYTFVYNCYIISTRFFYVFYCYSVSEILDWQFIWCKRLSCNCNFDCNIKTISLLCSGSSTLITKQINISLDFKSLFYWDMLLSTRRCYWLLYLVVMYLSASYISAMHLTVDYYKLFHIRLDDNLFAIINNLLAYWYSKQLICVRWNNNVFRIFLLGEWY